MKGIKRVTYVTENGLPAGLEQILLFLTPSHAAFSLDLALVYSVF